MDKDLEKIMPDFDSVVNDPDDLFSGHSQLGLEKLASLIKDLGLDEVSLIPLVIHLAGQGMKQFDIEQQSFNAGKLNVTLRFNNDQVPPIWSADSSAITGLSYSERDLTAGTYTEQLSAVAPNNLRIAGYRDFGHDRMKFEFHLKGGTKNPQPHKIDAYLLRVPVHDEILNGVDTATLGLKMKALDWSYNYEVLLHPGDSFEDPNRLTWPLNKPVWEVRNELNQIYGGLQQLREGYNPKGKQVAEDLEVKYWAWNPAAAEDFRFLINRDLKMVSGTFDPKVSAGECYTVLRQIDQHTRNINISTLNYYNRKREKTDYLFTNNLIYKIMNTQNAEFLKNTLLNLGFSDKLNADLEKEMAAQTPEFKLALQHNFNQKQVDYTLHFKAGDNQGMYFFNKYDATINHKDDPAKDVKQTFFINKGSGITAKEAFNLMEGRAVHKQLKNMEGQKYNAWLTLDNKDLTENGNKKIKHYHENYGYDLDKVIAGKGIRELEDSKAKEELMFSLKKGNAQQITVNGKDGDKKYFIAANPQFKTVDLFDHQMKKIKREELLHADQKPVRNVKQREQREDASAKKQSPKSKMHV